MTPVSKPCKNCGGTERYKTGHCKTCQNKRVHNWNKNNAAQLKATKAAWAKTNVEKQRVWYNAWKALNPEKARAATKAWYDANPDKVKAGRIQAREATKIGKRVWYENNRDRYRVYVQNRLKRLREVGGKLPVDIVGRLMLAQKGLCIYCETNIEQRYHIDHIMPLVLGGAHAEDNVQLLCPTCNLSKGSKHPDDFVKERKRHASSP